MRESAVKGESLPEEDIQMTLFLRTSPLEGTAVLLVWGLQVQVSTSRQTGQLV